MSTTDEVDEDRPDDDEPRGTVRWFGRTWDAPINRPINKVVVPVGQHCLAGDGKIVETDRGVLIPYLGDTQSEYAVYHLSCFLDSLGLLDADRPERLKS